MSTTPAHVAVSKYRWIVLFACWASFTLTSIDRSTWGPASVFVGEGLGVPLASLGAFATAYYIGYVISNAVGGVLSDAIGSRRTLTASLFGAGVLMVVFGSTSSAAVGIAVQALVGLFAGADYAAGIRLITSWFRPNELGLVMGVFLTATSIGLGIANAVVPSLIAWHSWETSYHLFGAISIGFSVVLFFVLKPGPLGAPPVVRNSSTRRRFLPDFSLILRNRNLLVVSVAGFGGFWGVYGFVTWANALMIKGHHIPSKTAGLVIVIFSIMAAVSKPLLGFIADKFFPRRRKLLIIVLLGVYGLGLVAFGSLGTTASFFWVGALLGLVAYAATTLMVALVPTLVPATVTGTAAGATNAFWQLGSTIVPVVVGAVFAGTGSFLAAFSTLAAGPLVGMLLMFGISEPRRGTPSTPRAAALVDGKQ
ncbi:MFS transporter [Amycolatopsis thermophila]|uniref:Sugar phosphate permease n=1 Tax=Amycolatopsis thermophila TaxID=206084 RepID=A0ABU0F7E2_9PSEU|nr:MFS transporter [Amycolatopsis thermophila]MDQ0383031.1 sugar phosphate permease [Amycolatopsis thermophila]